jgi:hypothetical protein
MIGRPQVTNEQSRCCVALPEAKGEGENIDTLGTTRLLFVFSLMPLSSRFPSNFFQEGVLQHGWYDSSSEENFASEADFGALERITLSTIKYLISPKKYPLVRVRS